MHRINFRHWQNQSFIVTVAILGLGLIHITFALIGLFCYIGPVISYLKTKKKTWCQHICPRASFLNMMLSKISLRLTKPSWLPSARIKTLMVIYLGLNMVFAVMSTFGVAFGRIEPINAVRLWMFFEVPAPLPQLWAIQIPSFLSHFSYRIYSMTVSTVLIGLILGFLFAPRTWCMICPVNTLSEPHGMKKVFKAS